MSVGQPNHTIPPLRLQFLAQLPLLLNSALQTKQVINVALQHLRNSLASEAATVFLLDESGSELLFWALHGGTSEKLSGKKIRADSGIAGWVIANEEPARVNDVSKDPRFLGAIDKEAGFKTRSILCVPLVSRGDHKLGALQALNKKDGDFSEEDLHFTEQLAHQLALAIDNARLFEELQRKNLQLEKLSKRKEEMISVIAHEFRTPLSVIQGSADLLSSGMLQGDANKQLASTLLNGVKRLSSLVAEIRNVSQIEQERLTPKLERTEIDSLFEEMKGRLTQRAEERKLTLRFSKDAALTAVSCDRSLILIALYNLIANSIRFTADGGSISVAARPSAGRAEFSVEDSGIGIEPSEIPLIFEKFYEVGDALRHSSGSFAFKSGGLGLGLPIAKKILEAHGSALDVKSAPAKGSTFSFRLESLT